MKYKDLFLNNKEKFLLYVKFIIIFLLLVFIFWLFFSKNKNVIDGEISKEEILKNIEKESGGTERDGVHNKQVEKDPYAWEKDILENSEKIDSENIASIVPKNDGIVQKDIEVEKTISSGIKTYSHNEEVVKNNNSVEPRVMSEYEKKKAFNKEEVNNIAGADVAMKNVGGGNERYWEIFDGIFNGNVSQYDRKRFSEISEFFSKQVRNYKNIDDKIKTKELREYLKNLENSFSNASKIMATMKDYPYDNHNNDDIESNKLLTNYAIEINNINRNYKNIHDFVIRKRIEFSRNEPGEFFSYSF